eukprot:c21371_g1_i1 orf=513-2549(-)
MVTFAETFQHWTDFPKGLQVLVVDGNTQFLQDITSKLESYQYYVTSFSSGEEACAVLASHTQTFHVALVEATENDGVDSCKILEFSKDVPTIMMSVMENMSMMVKSIALGAVEFLMKPPSEDKLKNIWQHVVRKALDSSRDSLRPGYLEPGKQTISTVTVEHEDPQACSKDDSNISELKSAENRHHEGGVGVSHSLSLSVTCERFAAPSTPQLDQGGRMALQEVTHDESPRSRDSTEVCNYKERVDLQAVPDNLSCSTASADVKEEDKEILPILPAGIVAIKKEEVAMDEQAQIFCCTIPMIESALHIEDADTLQTKDPQVQDSKISRKGEELERIDADCDGRAMTEICEVSCTEENEPQDTGKSSVCQSGASKHTEECPNADSTCHSDSLGHSQSKDEARDEIKKKSNDSENGGKSVKSSKKKIKVDWTADLHRRFVQAVEYLGVEQAIPSRILEVMKVDGLTRHNVASHLQKYRSHKKHIYAREVEASNWHQNKHNYGRPWNRAGQTVNQMWIQPCPQIICPPLHVWGHPKVENPVMHLMPQYTAGSNMWHGFDNPAWKHPMADSWVPGVPSMAPYYGPQTKFLATSGYPQGECPTYATWGSFQEDAENFSSEARSRFMKSESQELYPPKEVLDAAISEALSNPWTPLPLGLKPPSMESVMAELQRQGINTLSSLS